MPDLDPLVDRLAAYLCDDDTVCPDCVTTAGRAVKFLTNAGRLLPDGGETRTEWGVRWHGEDVTPYAAESEAGEVAALYPHLAKVFARQVGPWVEVTDA